MDCGEWEPGIFFAGMRDVMIFANVVMIQSCKTHPGPTPQLTRLEIFDGSTFVLLLPICYLKASTKIISPHNYLIFRVELRGIEPRTS